MQRSGVLVGFVFVVTACGPAGPNVPTKGIASSEDAAKATAKTKEAMSAMGQRASRQFGLSSSSEYNGTCATSGTAKIKQTATIGVSAGSAGINSTLTATADQCFKQNDFRISGQLVYAFTLGSAGTDSSGSTTFELKLDGRVALETFTSTGEVEQSGVIEFNDMVIKATSTASSGNGSFDVSWTVTATGNMVVGGQTYTADNSWGGTLAGMVGR